MPDNQGDYTVIVVCKMPNKRLGNLIVRVDPNVANEAAVLSRIRDELQEASATFMHYRVQPGCRVLSQTP